MAPCTVPATISCGVRTNFLRSGCHLAEAARYDAPGSRSRVCGRPPGAAGRGGGRWSCASPWRSGRWWSVVRVASSVGVRPVRARNTSSSVGRRRAMSSTARPRRRAPARRGSSRGAAGRGTEQRPGGRVGRAAPPADAAEDLGRPHHGRDVGGVHLEHVAAGPRLELARRALGDDPAPVDDHDVRRPGGRPRRGTGW